MGNKVEARALAASAGIPTVPGSKDPVATATDASKQAETIGYPVLLKAVGGGGGKGMRVVEAPGDLEHAFARARSEAQTAFGDGRVYMEKYLDHPRHVEVQILSDGRGNVLHLGERECSIQRRHQKIVEESPSTAIDDKVRASLTQAAVEFVRAGKYQNAGTVEFLVDGKSRFYFLELNARIQVEHPVTEMRTGIDIVREQIGIAEGKPLSISQEQVQFRGHAIECRIYAEDPENSFYPSTGKILRLRTPSGPFLREDQGIEEGSEVTPHYDPLLSKIIAWGSDRDQAIRRMRRALLEYEIHGLKTNVQYCLWLMSHPDFISGKIDTGFLDRTVYPGNASLIPEHIGEMLAGLAQTPSNGEHAAGRTGKSRWKQNRIDGYR
jgi:acetyl/propionyl-CoA carboxylase alpha subunit